MSNELLNAYIKFGEPDGDDLDFSQIADWAGYLLQEQRERITELEAENQRLRDALSNIVNYTQEIKQFRLNNENCKECEHAKKVNWPPSNLCSKHYSAMQKHRGSEERKYNIQHHELRRIARAALEKER